MNKQGEHQNETVKVYYAVKFNMKKGDLVPKQKTICVCLFLLTYIICVLNSKIQTQKEFSLDSENLSQNGA